MSQARGSSEESPAADTHAATNSAGDNVSVDDHGSCQEGRLPLYPTRTTLCCETTTNWGVNADETQVEDFIRAQNKKRTSLSAYASAPDLGSLCRGDGNNQQSKSLCAQLYWRS